MQNKVIVVTGANGDIGQTVVDALLRQGYEVAACVRCVERSNLKPADSLTLFSCDFTQQASVTQCLGAIKKRYKTLFGLVNCVGIAHGASFMMTKPQELASVFAINYFAVIGFSQQLVRKMLKQREGVVINLASTAGILSEQGTLAYGASKAALIHSSKVMASELGAFGVRVNAIAPGVVESSMANEMDQQSLAALEQRAALTSKIYPSEIADMVVFLLSDSAKNMTGQVLTIDRGISN